MSQISILPDGRVHIHGTTRELLEVLEKLVLHEEGFDTLLARAKGSDHGE